jgi:type IV secretory pathway VirD2 relaxase
MGERGDAIRTMQRAFTGEQRELAIFDPGQAGGRVVGRLAARGLPDGLSDKAYSIDDGVDGRAHYIVLSDPTPLEQAPVGSVIQLQNWQTSEWIHFPHLACSQ